MCFPIFQFSRFFQDWTFVRHPKKISSCCTFFRSFKGIYLDNYDENVPQRDCHLFKNSAKTSFTKQFEYFVFFQRYITSLCTLPVIQLNPEKKWKFFDIIFEEKSVLLLKQHQEPPTFDYNEYQQNFRIHFEFRWSSKEGFLQPTASSKLIRNSQL